MEENLQDEILASEDYNEYDISYPVIITRWEIRQIRGLNKRYIQVYFQKLNNTVQALRVNIACLSVFYNDAEVLPCFYINDVDKKDVEFSEIIPLKVDTRKVEITVYQCLLFDGTIVEKNDSKMAERTFKLFSEENKAAAKRLLPVATGYPVDNDSYWYCTCGKLNLCDKEECIACKTAKNDVFNLITEENIDKENEKIKIESEETKNRKQQQKDKRNKLIALVSVVCLLIVILVCTLTPFGTISVNGVTYRRHGDYYYVYDFEGKTEINIPAKVRGLPVTGVYAERKKYNNLTKITVDKTNAYLYSKENCVIDKASGELLLGCQSSIIPVDGSVTRIGDCAFSGCSGLMSITIPQSVKSIGWAAFV